MDHQIDVVTAPLQPPRHVRRRQVGIVKGFSRGIDPVPPVVDRELSTVGVGMQSRVGHQGARGSMHHMISGNQSTGLPTKKS
jgi:hypothetical protein